MAIITGLGKIITGAFAGGVIGFVGSFILVSVLGFSYGGPLLALYFSGYLIICIAVPGLLIGALVATHYLFKTPITNLPSVGYRRYVKFLVFSLVLLVGITGFIMFYGQINVYKSITHQAIWQIIPSSSYYGNCSINLVRIVVRASENIQVICSKELLDSLQETNPATISVTYGATYNFGEMASCRLVQVGSINMTWDILEASMFVGCNSEDFIVYR